MAISTVRTRNDSVATVAPPPTSNWLNARRYASTGRCSVADSGPPLVSSHTTSNLLNIQILRSSTVTVSMGASIGIVMCQNRIQALAPSTRAASYKDFGTVCSAARKHTVTNGVQVQTLTMIRISMAEVGFSNQAGLPKPACSAQMVNSPSPPSSSHWKITVTTTVGSR